MKKDIINHYKLKSGITIDEILSELKRRGISYKYIHKDSYWSFWKNLVDEIEVCVVLPKDLSEWNDEDYVLVLDDAYGQPYTPFYSDHKFPFLLNVIGHYNKFMDSLDFLERI